MDAQVGALLDEVRALDEERRTIVVFFGDHGWQLGEWAEWEKFTNFEMATRTPLIVAVPPGVAKAGRRGVGAGAGAGAAGSDMLRNASTRALVELVDVMPTLVELAGGNVSGLGLEGMSLLPLLLGEAQHADDRAAAAAAAPPSSSSASSSLSSSSSSSSSPPSSPAALTAASAPAADWAKDAAFSQFPRCTLVYPTKWARGGRGNVSRPAWSYNDCNDIPRANFSHMGLSVRVDGWRFTRWLRWDGAVLRPIWPRTHAAGGGGGGGGGFVQSGNASAPLEELYDHTTDTGNTFDGDFELVNLAYRPEHRARRDRLDRRLRQQFAPWLPPPTPAPPARPAKSAELGLSIGLGVAILGAGALLVRNSRRKRAAQHAGHGKQALLGASLVDA